MTDRVGEVCNNLNQSFAEAVRGIAQPLADAARKAVSDADYYRREVEQSKALLNQTEVASRGEVENEPSLLGKVQHLVFIAESAESAERELREEVCELRQQLAELAWTFAEVALRHAQTAA